MNSRDRRKFKRKWKHVVRLPEDWYYLDITEDDGPLDWAKSQFGYHKYYLDITDNHYALRFDDADKATQFALRWA